MLGNSILLIEPSTSYSVAVHIYNASIFNFIIQSYDIDKIACSLVRAVVKSMSDSEKKCYDEIDGVYKIQYLISRHNYRKLS